MKAFINNWFPLGKEMAGGTEDRTERERWKITISLVEAWNFISCIKIKICIMYHIFIRSKEILNAKNNNTVSLSMHNF